MLPLFMGYQKKFNAGFCTFSTLNTAHTLVCE